MAALAFPMASPSQPAAPAPVSPDRLWAEQLAFGLGLIIALLSFMAFFHPKLLSVGGKVLAPDDLPAYGWAAAIGVVVQLVFHEAGTLLAARILGLPLRFRFFPFGAHATAILSHQPRRVWIDAVIGLAGPLTGVCVSLLCAAIYYFSDNPFFLGMSCVGCFYNLFTLVPLLDLEGGWVARRSPRRPGSPGSFFPSSSWSITGSISCCSASSASPSRGSSCCCAPARHAPISPARRGNAGRSASFISSSFSAWPISAARFSKISRGWCAKTWATDARGASISLAP